ncbi:hypothetical protein TNCV_101881 [Trichonephila clavipes]|nr:hypothetical protein TNCV_101881 [Trichonephila clavipes]
MLHNIQMHLPLIRTGISVKAGSSFVTPAVSSLPGTNKVSPSLMAVRVQSVLSHLLEEMVSSPPWGLECEVFRVWSKDAS